MGICNLQHSSQQAEDALSQGMEALQQSLVETLSRNSIGSRGSGNVDDYMGQMGIAMSKLATLENFLHQVFFAYIYIYIIDLDLNGICKVSVNHLLFLAN